jgi:dipeptidyl aminopeptidase/acylaminoacyl peptidase
MDWNATLNATAQTEVRMLDDNAELREAVAKMAYPRIEKFAVPTPDGRDIKAKVYLPPELVRHEDIKYPLVLHV